ncbi:tetratricopeptide (TPR) repeat protein [Pedobacter africanus]|uniref:Tetratricopeptide (TPR) repeat protein n=1 Tax=Pedobacter africanus TaxID=151894 RepID=A0ACC6KXD8_9SPHI|nr:RagB/SusD family nutrient uptake outer membrane protein [Pedobacter africanus]MDR6783779.1 tetratricopeptide (TPR) repeat protein [Pedobacter africanus]
MKTKHVKHKWRLIFVFISGLTLASGCTKDWLDIKSDKRQAVPETNEDLQAILDDISVINNQTSNPLAMGEIAADGHYYTDQTFQEWGNVSFEYQNIYSWSSIYRFENIAYDGGGYSQAYQAIANCNVVLGSKAGKNEIKEFTHVNAQALFHRGRIYYNLAQTLIKPYSKQTANTDPGLALMVTNDVTVSTKRSTIEQTYDLIISDITRSIDGLPAMPLYLSRASKIAAFGMLARIYLNMNDYDNAYFYANEYLKLSPELLDYNSLSTTANFIGINKEMKFVQLSSNNNLRNRYLVEHDLYNSFDNDDLRKAVFFNTSSGAVQFKGKYSHSASFNFFGIATDEIYLIRAECLARKGDLSKAMKDLNDLLRSRWAKNPDGSSKYVDQTANDELTALHLILKERRKELILRGIRWSDLRRLNQDPRFAVTLKRTILGKEYTLAPNSDRYTFPFPKEVIERSEITQNPGW